MELYTVPRGEAYKQVIDLAISHSEFFVLGEKIPDWAVLDRGQYTGVLEKLAPYLVKTIEVQAFGPDNMDEIEQLRKAYRSNAFYSAGIYYFYRCCEESGDILKQSATNLADWIYPHLPEDLCFLKEGGGDYLYSIVHEQMYGMGVTEEEATELMNQITGLFFKLEDHRNLDRLLDDAFRHQSDRLYISGHRLTELPERIRELTELRELEIFEQDLYRLPGVLFELSKLERLRIMTADLEEIPAAIAKLKNLRTLSISCGSSDRPAAGWRVKPKEEIRLNRIPPEIGELAQLEHLTICYTSIKALPPELAKLKRLKSLDIGFSMVKQKPDFLNDMKELQYVMLPQDHFGGMNEE